MVAVLEVAERYCSTESAIFEKVERAIASMILEELQEALRCDQAFASSPDALAKLAASAMAKYHVEKPGFLPNLRAGTRLLVKKPGF
jgi:streptomycin 6-kinase